MNIPLIDYIAAKAPYIFAAYFIITFTSVFLGFKLFTIVDKSPAIKANHNQAVIIPAPTETPEPEVNDNIQTSCVDNPKITETT